MGPRPQKSPSPGRGERERPGDKCARRHDPFSSHTTPATAIAAILSDMDTEIAALETKLAKARQIKQGTMYNLLTGRIRLV